MVIKSNILDNGILEKLLDGATIVEGGFPLLQKTTLGDLPEKLIPFTKLKFSKDKNGFIHFYEHDKTFYRFLTNPDEYLDDLRLYPGVISPDSTLSKGLVNYLQGLNVLITRAVAYYLQKNGFKVIVNVRWSDEDSFKYCFLGIPYGSVVSISTHGCIRGKENKASFKKGLKKLIEVINPECIIVYGRMPQEIFDEFSDKVKFVNYESEFAQTHQVRG